MKDHLNKCGPEQIIISFVRSVYPSRVISSGEPSQQSHTFLAKSIAIFPTMSESKLKALSCSNYSISNTSLHLFCNISRVSDVIMILQPLTCLLTLKALLKSSLIIEGIFNIFQIRNIVFDIINYYTIYAP